jgi:hypothetical protein
LATERAAESRLLRRQDGRVGDRQPERVSEQRDHGKPVRDAAHEPGLGRGLEQVGPDRSRQRVAAQHQRRHEQEQRGGGAAVPTQRLPRLGVGIGREHGGGR